MEFSKENIKPGMKVKIKNRRGEGWNYFGEMDYLMGTIVKVQDIFTNGFYVKRKYGDNVWFLNYDDIENIVYDHFTKAYLQEGDIVTDGEGDISVYHNGRLIGNTVGLYGLDDNLKDGDGCSQNDIVKVERPVKLETIWERQESETVEMTVEELEEKLGIEKGKLRVRGEKNES